MHLGRISCIFGQHKPKRRSMYWNGSHYVGTCRSCQKVLRKIPMKGWRPVPKELLQKSENPAENPAKNPD